MLCGLLKPDEGEGTCLGYDIRTEAEAIKRQVGYMTQRFSFWEDLSIRENLEFVARVYEVADTQGEGRRDARAAGACRSAQNQLAGELSGGWKQRWRWPPACCTSRDCCCWTSRPPASIRKARRDFWEEIHRLSDDGPDRARQHALHGRSRALRPHRLHQSTARSSRSGTVRRGDRAIRAHHLRDRRRRRAPPAVASWRASPASSMSRSSARRCMSAATTARRSKRRSRRCAAIAGFTIARSAPSLEDVFIHLQDARAAA